MKKKLLAIFLTICMTVTLVPAAFAQDSIAPEENPAEVVLQEKLDGLYGDLLELYEEETEEAYTDAALILAALAEDEEAEDAAETETPDGEITEETEEPELPEGYALPEFTEDELLMVLSDLYTEEQIDAIEEILTADAENDAEAGDETSGDTSGDEVSDTDSGDDATSGETDGEDSGDVSDDTSGGSDETDTDTDTGSDLTDTGSEGSEGGEDDSENSDVTSGEETGFENSGEDTLTDNETSGEPTVEDPENTEEFIEVPGGIGNINVDEFSAADLTVQALFNLLNELHIADAEALAADMLAEGDIAYGDVIGILTVLKVEEDEEILEEELLEEEVLEEDTREIVYHVPTVDFTDAAPFLDPVEGEQPALFRMVSPLSLMAAAEEEGDDNGLELDKSVSEPDDNGIYTLTLESWATGAKTTIKQEKNIPTDIILVLDQSGSMDESFSNTAYRTTSGTPEELYNDRSTLYVKLADNIYSPVSVTRTSVTTGTNYEAYPNQNNYTYDSNESNLYHKCSDGVYGKVTVNTSGNWGSRRYSYTCANGCTLNIGSNNEWDDTPEFDDTLYRKVETTEYQYTFSYEKADRTTETATVSANESAPNWDFYESYASGNTTRLAALKSAVTTFASEVATKAKGTDGVLGTEDDVDHTISVVGFGRANYGNSPYYNTEVFVGSTAYRYNNGNSNANNTNAAQQHYDDAPQDMSTTTGVANITASINALDAEGGTYVDLGIEMANGILNANPVPTGETRNRVVIVFTDGAPGYDGSWGEGDYNSTSRANATTVAKEALDEANTTKNTYGATVYTVGIFDGADATGTTLPAYSTSNSNNSANRFMHLLSSNYPDSDSDSMTDSSLNGTTIPNTGYYLSASDSSALNSIFRTISQNIESGGSSVTLDETAVVKDVITDQFVLPEGTSKEDIKVYTSTVDTTTGEFTTLEEFTDANVTISDDGRTVSVSNFDFADNWVGTETATDGTVTYRGKKLIIEIPIKVRDGFLGGNNVFTNGNGSGVYKNEEAATAVEEFVSPTVDIEIENITVTAPDKNVYLLGNVIEDELVAGLTVMSGTVELDMDATNCGLEPWQNAYVDISTSSVSGYTDLKTDTPYSVAVTITPNEEKEGGATAKTGSGTGNIFVFMPEVTFTDDVGYYGDYAPHLDDNAGTVVWTHASSTGTPSGTEPSITITATADPTGVVDNKIAVKSDIPVNATAEIVEVKDGIETKTLINDYITYKWTKCDSDNNSIELHKGSDDNVPEFYIHVKTCSLKITKSGGSSDEPYVIYVNKDGDRYTELTVLGGGSKTIYELPVGTYTIEEDTNWSWRYTPNTSDSAELKASKDYDEITCINTSNEKVKWLNHFSEVVANIFGIPKSETN